MSGTVKLKTLSENGQPPVTRLASARETAATVDQLVEANGKRCSTDAIIKGMIDGNPPYRQADLDAQAQSWRCNKNWRIAESFLNIALSVYWDIVAEGRTKATCTTDWGESNDQKQHWSGIITEEFERLNTRDSSFNNMFRNSQHDMVLYRMGPVMWQDAFDFRAKAVKCSNLLTLDNTSSDINEWKLAVVRSTYSADELYAFVRNPEAARKAGWNVAYAKKILMDAVPLNEWPSKKQNWEWYQQRIRNNDIYWAMECESIHVAHVFVREFIKPGESEGRVSHFMVIEGGTEDKYLYERVGRYENWRQIICPFYYDTGDGTHHSVKGMGIKAQGALDTINRLMCHEVDVAILGSAFNFQFKGAADKEKIQLMQYGVVNFWDENITLIPTNNTGQLIAAPSITRQQLLSTVTANLSQYRQGLEREKGNPATAREINWRADNQNFIGRSAVTYYFDQEDDFYAERFRRAANPNLTESRPGAKEALMFQERCFKRGVPKEALQKMESVRATRTVGYGSPDARRQTMMGLLGRLPLYSETGRQRILKDITVQDVGYALAEHYMPETGPSPAIEFQRKQAQQDVALLRLNIMPLITPDSNALIYAETFVLAGSQALEGLSQGAGSPEEVVQFVDNCGQAATAHLQRIKDDSTRKQEYDMLMEQVEQMGKANDQLVQQIQQQAQQNGQQQQKTQQAMTDEQIKDFKARRDSDRKDGKAEVDKSTKIAKTNLGMTLQTLKERQRMAIEDVKTSREILNEERNGEDKE